MRIIVGLIFSLCILQQLSAQDSKQPVFPDFHNGAVTGIDLSKNNRWLLTGGADGRAMLFDAEKKTLIRQLKGHYDAITGVSFADKDTRVVTSSFDGKLIIWEAKSGVQKRNWNAVSGTMDKDKNWSRNPLFPPFCLDSSKQSMVFFLTQSAITEASDYRQNTKLCFYDFNQDTVRWTMTVKHFDTEGRPFSLSSNGDWLLFTDYARNVGTGNDEPYIRLIFTADTALQYKWWGNEAAFDGNEVVVCNGHNLLRFNPANESSLVRNINGGYGYNKQFAAPTHILMQCMQQKEAGNIAARNFNVRSPFQRTADSILYYLTGSREMKLPYWRVSDLKTQQTFTIVIKGDSSAAWQPVYRINETLLTHGLMAFTKGNEQFAFVEVNSGNAVIMSFFPGKSFPKAIASLRNSAGRWLISLEHEPAKKHEAALYELTLDFSTGKGSLNKFLSSPILNQSLSVEDDNQILPDLIIFPDGNRVLSSDKRGGIRISDYASGTIREDAVLLPGNKIQLEPAAINANGSMIRCFSSFDNLYSFSSKTGQPQTTKKIEMWRLLPDQSIFNKAMVCYDADSTWKIEYARGKALITNLKNKTFTLIYTGESGMADFQLVNNRFLFGMGTDGGLRAYSLETRQLIFTQYMFENGGNLIMTPDGRMDANEQAQKLLYTANGMNINTFGNSVESSELGFIQVTGLRKQLLR
jgi:hypothetical protein